MSEEDELGGKRFNRRYQVTDRKSGDLRKVLRISAVVPGKKSSNFIQRTRKSTFAVAEKKRVLNG